MAKYIRSPWIPLFWKSSLYFHPVAIMEKELRFYNDWPSLEEYQNLLQYGENKTKNANLQPLKIVAQGAKPISFEEKYAPRIYLKGELQTRTENWHDFFQIITWRLFPKSKAIINQRQYFASLQHSTKDPGHTGRSSIENLLSLFDECGAVIICSDPKLSALGKGFEWKQLFWENKSTLKNCFSCVIFGHALYEKLFNPYIGMTANSIYIECEPDYFKMPLGEQIRYIDNELSNRLANETLYRQPSDLFPFPILGMPGWYQNNDREDFYDNSNYFRPRKKLCKGNSTK